MNSFFSSKPILKFGIISGLLLVLNELILYYATNTNPFIGERTSLLSLIGLFIPALMVVIAIVFLKKNATIESFGQIVKPGLVIGFITALIFIGYTMLFIYSIEPDTLNQFDEVNKQRLLESGQLTKEEDINAAVQLARNAFIPGTILFNIAINLFIGFLTAVITAIFVRNK